MDAWEERFAGNPNLVIELIKGGTSIRVRLFCNTQKEADAIVARFGGSVRKMAQADWDKPVAPPRPVKVRDVFVLTAEKRPKELSALKKANPKRELICIPPEMAFGTGDHATTSTQLEQTRKSLGTAREEARQALAKIASMQSSKFWKLRRIWFRLKRWVGLGMN